MAEPSPRVKPSPTKTKKRKLEQVSQVIVNDCPNEIQSRAVPSDELAAVEALCNKKKKKKKNRESSENATVDEPSPKVRKQAVRSVKVLASVERPAPPNTPSPQRAASHLFFSAPASSVKEELIQTPHRASCVTRSRASQSPSSQASYDAIQQRRLDEDGFIEVSKVAQIKKKPPHKKAVDREKRCGIERESQNQMHVPKASPRVCPKRPSNDGGHQEVDRALWTESRGDKCQLRTEDMPQPGLIGNVEQSKSASQKQQFMHDNIFNFSNAKTSCLQLQRHTATTERRRLFVGNIPRGWPRAKIMAAFQGFSVTDLIQSPWRNDDSRTRYALLTLASTAEAEEAIKSLSGKLIFNALLNVELASSLPMGLDRQKNNCAVERTYVTAPIYQESRNSSSIEGPKKIAQLENSNPVGQVITNDPFSGDFEDNVAGSYSGPAPRRMHSDRVQGDTVHEPPEQRQVGVNQTCTCRNMPLYFQGKKPRFISFDSWPGRREDFIIHAGNIIKCAAHTQALKSACQKAIDSMSNKKMAQKPCAISSPKHSNATTSSEASSDHHAHALIVPELHSGRDSSPPLKDTAKPPKSAMPMTKVSTSHWDRTWPEIHDRTSQNAFDTSAGELDAAEVSIDCQQNLSAKNEISNASCKGKEKATDMPVCTGGPGPETTSNRARRQKSRSRARQHGKTGAVNVKGRRHQSMPLFPTGSEQATPQPQHAIGNEMARAALQTISANAQPQISLSELHSIGTSIVNKICKEFEERGCVATNPPGSTSSSVQAQASQQTAKAKRGATKRASARLPTSRTEIRGLKYPQRSADVPQENRHSDTRLIEIGKIIKTYQRHLKAPYAFSRSGMLEPEYRYLYEASGWNHTVIKRLNNYGKLTGPSHEMPDDELDKDE